MKKLQRILSFFTCLFLIISITPTANATYYGIGKNSDGVQALDLPLPDIEITNGYNFINYVQRFVGDTYTRGRCQMFVQECYLRCFGNNNAGGGCCATNAYNRYCTSDHKGDWNIPLGAAVYFSGSSTICGTCNQAAGHVGIYVGDSNIVHVWGGAIRKDPITFVTGHSGYSYRGWGWQGRYEIPQVKSAVEEYLEQCTKETCNVNLTITVAGNMKTMPCSVDTNPLSETVDNKPLIVNDTYPSTVRWRNTQGATWYEVTSKTGKRGFIYSGDVSVSMTPSTLRVTGHESGTPSGTLTLGASFGLRGTISSNYTITYIEAHIYDSSGKDAMESYKVTWNSKNYNIQTDGLNDYFSFRTLKENDETNLRYRYVVAASDAYDSSKRILIDSYFTVGSGAYDTTFSTEYPNTWTNTGNQAIDIAEIAYTQVGYVESHYSPTDKNHCKYNYWYYGYDKGDNGNGSAAWCAVFVSWCASQAGVPQSIIHRTTYAYPGSDDFNVPYYNFSSVSAEKGDLIFVENGGDLDYGNVYGFDHVGIVYAVDNSYIYTVEGNDNNSVTYNMYSKATGVDVEESSAYIAWIGKPNYSGSQPIQQDSTLNISGYTGKPGTPGTAGTLVQGENYGLRGIISSNYTITQVTAHIYNASNTDALSPYSTSWNSTSYNIQSDGINNAFSFARLSEGAYRYVVSASDASGTTKTLIDSSFTVGQTSQPVVIPTGTISEKLATILTEYPDGSSWTDTFDGSKKSYGFAGLVVYKIFGNSTVPGKTYRWWLYSGVSESGMQTIGEVGSCTVDNVRSLLASARPGDVLQFDQGASSGTQFSMIVYSLTDSGAYIYDCNYFGDSIVRLHHFTYSDFVTLQGDGPKGKLTLLRSDNYDLIEPPVQTTVFDLNGCLDGNPEWGSLEGYGTVDVYINGNLVAQNVGDYYEALPVGTTYEIKNIQALDGHVYLGVHSGALSGTIGTEQVNVILSFNTLAYLNMDGYLDGVANDGLQQYGTADIYVNGSLVGSGWNDYWAAWHYGSTYEIKNIRAKDGYRYNGVRSGALTGTIGKDRIDVVLSFSTVHTYSFDANGDYGTMVPIQVALDDPITFPACSFEREGYTFQGWEAYRVNDGKYGVSGTGWRTPLELEQAELAKTVYPDKLSFTFNRSWTEGINGPCRFILYAVWKADTYMITFNSNGGAGAPAAQEKTHGELLTLSSLIPSREGYYFLGWTTSASASVPEYQPGGLFNLNSNTTLYAVWEQADFYLPASLTLIEEEAFENCAFRFVKLSENTSEIQYHAFADCKNFAYIYIPPMTTVIDPEAFGNMQSLTILGKTGTTAETYARNHNFNFIAVP